MRDSLGAVLPIPPKVCGSALYLRTGEKLLRLSPDCCLEWTKSPGWHCSSWKLDVSKTSSFLLELFGFDVRERRAVLLSPKTCDTGLGYMTVVVLMGCNGCAGSCGRRDPMVQGDSDIQGGVEMLVWDKMFSATCHPGPGPVWQLKLVWNRGVVQLAPSSTWGLRAAVIPKWSARVAGSWTVSRWGKDPLSCTRQALRDTCVAILN